MNTFFSPDFYIDRIKEIKKISSGLSKNGAVVITGHAGIGKTVLAKLYAKQNQLNFSRIYFYKASEFNYEEPKNDGRYLPHKTNNPILTIVDGIDEIEGDVKRERIVDYFLESKKYGHKVMLTCRPYLFYSKNKFNAYQLNLESLSESEALELFLNRVGKYNSKEASLSEVKDLLNKVQYNPLGIVAAVELLRSDKFKIAQVIDQIYRRIDYQDYILEDGTNSKLLLPQIPKIIDDVKVINSSLIEKVKTNPNYIHSMSSRQFEEFVAELFEKDGYNVSLTQQTHDGGKDIFIVENKRFGKFIYYVECKQYSSNIPVGVRLVRELYGTVVADRATAGVLVTSSYFSKEAIQFTEQIKAQMSLMEFVDLKKWVIDISSEK